MRQVANLPDWITCYPLCLFAGRKTGKGEAKQMSHKSARRVKNFINNFPRMEEYSLSSSRVTCFFVDYFVHRYILIT